MCNPTYATPLIGGALGFGQSMVNQYGAYQSQKQQYASDMAEFNAKQEIAKRQADDKAKALRAQANLDYQQIRLSEQQANESAAMQKSALARELDKAKALTQLSAVEAGISGNAVTRMMADLGFTEAQKQNAIEMQRVNQIDQAGSDKIAAHERSKMQPNYFAIPQSPRFSGTSVLSGVLSGVNSYLSSGGYDSLFSRKVNQVSESSSLGVSRLNSGLSKRPY